MVHHKDVHTSSQETIEGLLRAAHDGLILVERGVEHDGNAGQVAEGLDEFVVTWVGFPVDRLQSAGAVDMGYRRNQGPLFFPDLEDLHHERNVVFGLEPLGDGLP